MPAGAPQAPEACLPRSLVLTQEDRAIVVSRLARGVLKFQDDMISSSGSPAGLLCQVWLPEVVEDSQIVLKTKDLPFCVAGLGDLLALFRCISCRFAFGTNVQRPNTLGAPGRVFASSEPEMCCNVQRYSKAAYLRKAEAEQCQVQSTLLLPLFINAQRSGCVGVLEVVQTSEDMAFIDVAKLLATSLERCELFTCPTEVVRRKAPSVTAAPHLVLPSRVGVLAPPGNTSEDDSASGVRGSGGGGDAAMADAGVLRRMVLEEGGCGGAGNESGGDLTGDEEEDEEDEDGSDGGGERRKGKPGSKSGRRKGTGNPGKPGVRLTLEDLQSQFGVGLKEAANRLGICPTTLKRACRRHGIQRWPRRQLQKVNRALDELEARQMMHPQQHLAAAPAPGCAYDAMGSLPAADTRWTTLAHFVPSHTNAGGLGGHHDQSMQLSAAPQQSMHLPWGPMLGQQQQQQQLQQQQLQQQQLQQQQQQQHYQLHQRMLQQHPMLAVGGDGGPGSGSLTPEGSHMSLPEGALAMGAGGGMHGGGGGRAMQEVSTVSGVSSLGQPPPQSLHQEHRSCGGQVMQQRAHPQHLKPEPLLQPHQLQQQGGLAPLSAALQRQQSGSSNGHASGPQPISSPDTFLQQHRVGSAPGGTTYNVSPFGHATAAAAASGACGGPIVQLPNTNGLGGGTGTALPSISSLSVPSIHGLDISLPSHMHQQHNNGGSGQLHACDDGTVADSPPDEDQVGFLDASVLELLLSEDQRKGSGGMSAAFRGSSFANCNAPAASVGTLPAASSDLLPGLPGLSAMPAVSAVPGISTGFSGLSFML